MSLFIGRVNRKGRVTAGQIADCGFPLPRWQRYFEFIFKKTHAVVLFAHTEIKINLPRSRPISKIYSAVTRTDETKLGKKKGDETPSELTRRRRGNAGRSPPPSRRERRTKGYAHSRHSPQHYSLDAVTSPVARYDGGQGERGARARQRAL